MNGTAAIVRAEGIFFGAGARLATGLLLAGALAAADLADRLELSRLTGREVAAYSVSCKSQAGVNLVLDWLTKHAKCGWGCGERRGKEGERGKRERGRERALPVFFRFVLV